VIPWLAPAATGITKGKKAITGRSQRPPLACSLGRFQGQPAESHPVSIRAGPIPRLILAPSARRSHWSAHAQPGARQSAGRRVRCAAPGANHLARLSSSRMVVELLLQANSHRSTLRSWRSEAALNQGGAQVPAGRRLAARQQRQASAL